MTTDRQKLHRLKLTGFKSIREMDLDFGDVTLLLGANGSGKSNLLAFFRLFNLRENQLDSHVARQGGANALLHYGAKQTREIFFEMTTTYARDHQRHYVERMIFSSPDRLVISGDAMLFDPHAEENPLKTIKSIVPWRDVEHRQCRIEVYQFHDTTETARIRLTGQIGDCRQLHADGGNLAAFLKAMETASQPHYARILRHIRAILPQFDQFDLRPTPGNDKTLLLNWRDFSQDYLFGPHQISDGALRFMALAALLLQPPATMPSVIVIDEPELGLHPAAIAELAGMIRTASAHCQVIVATQSTRLVDEFQASELVVVERDETNHCSLFKRLDENELSDWLARYSLSELWEKNVLGGRP